ncbi:MAG: tyrosine-type recombinase/integrase [Chloroflexota bacterium]|nr:tyrosine-type recombinase/integrase [Chloroflexota bacterium]
MFPTQKTAYLQTLQVASTRASYARALTQFETWYLTTYDQAPDASLLTDEEVHEWREHLVRRCRLSAASVNQRLAALRGVARHHGRQLIVKGMKKVSAPLDPLNGREIGRLFAVLAGEGWMSKRNVALLSLLVRAGLRVSEVVALYPADVSTSERKGHVLVRQGKGGKERIVPLSRRARQDLASYAAVRPAFAAEPLFVSHTGQALAARDVQRVVTKAARLAGLTRHVTPHLLRHTFATRALRRGEVDLATLSALLGHDNLTTTARYLHPDQEHLAAMIEEL